jgi:hypothetical protein
VKFGSKIDYYSDTLSTHASGYKLVLIVMHSILEERDYWSKCKCSLDVYLNTIC